MSIRFSSRILRDLVLGVTFFVGAAAYAGAGDVAVPPPPPPKFPGFDCGKELTVMYAEPFLSEAKRIERSSYLGFSKVNEWKGSEPKTLGDLVSGLSRDQWQRLNRGKNAYSHGHLMSLDAESYHLGGRLERHVAVVWDDSQKPIAIRMMDVKYHEPARIWIFKVKDGGNLERIPNKDFYMTGNDLGLPARIWDRAMVFTRGRLVWSKLPDIGENLELVTGEQPPVRADWEVGADPRTLEIHSDGYGILIADKNAPKNEFDFLFPSGLYTQAVYNFVSVCLTGPGVSVVTHTGLNVEWMLRGILHELRKRGIDKSQLKAQIYGGAGRKDSYGASDSNKDYAAYAIDMVKKLGIQIDHIDVRGNRTRATGNMIHRDSGLTLPYDILRTER
jgi:hypothetical protein